MVVVNLQKIYISKNSTIYKGKEQGFDNDVVIKVLEEEYPSEDQINTFNNEYDFTKDLNIQGVRKVLKKSTKSGKHSLILDYFDGKELIQYIIKNDSNILSKLQIAINIAQTLGEIHTKNIIHKDINTNNILINNKNEINIIDFGLATKYKLKTQNLFNPEHLEGTLPYISPEQTGRMNRSVDYRTDLYSLGVILYELFTNKLPFEEKDNMELIHSHIAKTPVPPSIVNKRIPKVISDIILQLLSKNAENRYQSAYGLKYDLEHIYRCLESNTEYDNFELCTKDFSGRLSIPEKLYGRETEIKQLFDIFELVSRSNKELLLIAGSSGVGKSALIHEIHKPLTLKRGFYIEGKFDQLQKNIPYYAIIKAFTDFAHLILKENEDKLNYWKKLIQQSVGEIGKVITDLVPEIELIIGKQKELPKLEGKEAQNRFNYVWTNFIDDISTAEHPLILFIDDLQWADNSSFELLKTLLSNHKIQYLFCIIAYRDNEISYSNLEEITSIEDLNISNIKLDNLSKEDVDCLTKDTLKTKESDYSEILSELIFSKTLGNAFFTVQFLKNLYEEEFLKFDFNENIWKWNFEEIENQNITDNVIDLMLRKVEKLRSQTQDILKIAACIGSIFDVKFLSIISNKNETICKKDLESAIYENLILPLDNNTYKFVHDRIQQAVYSIIPDFKKNNFHLKTGRLLLKSWSGEMLDNQIFDIVNQLNYGINIITTPEEKRELSKLNLQAGKKAKQSSAYLPAYNYLVIAKRLLQINSWEGDYKFTLEIYNELTELSFLTGTFENIEKDINTIIVNSKQILDKVDAYLILIYTNIANSKIEKSMEIGLKILEELNITFPKKISKLHILFGLLKTTLSIKKIKKRELIKLPLSTNDYIAAQVRLIDTLGSVAFWVNKSLLPLFIFKGINLIIKNGHSISSPYFITAYGFILGTLNKYKEADKYAKISKIIQGKFDFATTECRTTYTTLFFIDSWSVRMDRVIKEFNINNKLGFETGKMGLNKLLS